MDQEQESSGNKMVGKFMTDELREAWRKFMEKFQQSFDVDQLDSVLSFLRESESNGQNPSKKKRIAFMEEREEMSAENNSQYDHAALREQRVFGNHLLAKSVFKCLPHADLLSCRLVNSYWNEFATKVLLKRGLEMQFQRKITRFFLRGSNWKSLDMFTQLLRTSKQFPCNKFMFDGGNLGNDDAQRFFALYGSSIKIIEIFLNDRGVSKDRAKSETGFCVSLTDSRVIGRILSQHLPNLEDLTLNVHFGDNNKWLGHTSLLFPPEEKVELPNLKKLSYDSRTNVDDALFRQLLVAATNLERFELSSSNFDLDCLDTFIQTGKVKCIANLNFPTEVEKLDKLEEMLKHEPQLSSLYAFNLEEVYHDSSNWARMSRLLTQLLNCSKNSLEEIGRLSSFGFLPQLHLPVLQNVRELDLDLDFDLDPESTFKSENVHDYSYSVLPRGATFSVNFPRLISVKLDFDSEISDEDAADEWKKRFPTDQSAPTVKKLDVCGFCPVLWMEKLSKMFPNLEELEVGYIKDFPSFSKIVWTSCRKLKRLTVEIGMVPLNSHPALDSSFTGLSPEVCNQLGERSTSELESVAGSYMENEPSLLDLTELCTMHIILNFTDVSNYNPPTVLSHLTGICVFKPLKGLQQVTIEYFNRPPSMIDEASIIQGLELLTPYKVKIAQ